MPGGGSQRERQVAWSVERMTRANELACRVTRRDSFDDRTRAERRSARERVASDMTPEWQGSLGERVGGIQAGVFWGLDGLSRDPSS